MGDIIDQAQEAEVIFLRAALSRRRIEAGAPRTHCVDCGAPIPEMRRRAVPGCSRCVTCQQELELREWEEGYPL